MATLDLRKQRRFMQELPETRRTLLVRLGQRSDDAWGEFLAVYERAILRFCQRRGLQESDARDVTQEILTAVYKRVDSWDFDKSKGTFRGWLFAVARNTVLDCLAARQRRVQGTGDSKILDLLTELPDQPADASDFWLEYRRTLFRYVSAIVKDEVRPATWDAFWQTAVEGRKPEEVSQELGMSVGGVYTAKCRVVARVRAKLADLDDPDETLTFGQLAEE